MFDTSILTKYEVGIRIHQIRVSFRQSFLLLNVFSTLLSVTNWPKWTRFTHILLTKVIAHSTPNLTKRNTRSITYFATSIEWDVMHPLNQHFIPLPSGSRYRILKFRKAHLGKSSIPAAIPALRSNLMSVQCAGWVSVQFGMKGSVKCFFLSCSMLNMYLVKMKFPLGMYKANLSPNRYNWKILISHVWLFIWTGSLIRRSCHAFISYNSICRWYLVTPFHSRHRWPWSRQHHSRNDDQDKRGPSV